ncbi:MAG: hypothetical protein ACM3ZT_02575 [Bacillota bacterium]
MYFLAVQWVDVLWTVLVFFGVEKVHVEPGVNPSGPLVFDYYPYTHSLMAAVGWAAVAYGFYRFVLTRRQGSQLAAGMLALCVASHWVLDLVVHLPDLPLTDESRKVGLGLWNFPMLELATELLLLFGGLAFYFARTPELTRAKKVTLVIFCFVMTAFQAAGSFGPPPPSIRIMAVSGFILYAGFALIAYFLERKPVKA